MGRQVRRRRDGHGPPSLLTTQRSGLSLTRDVDVLPVFSVSAEGGSSPWSSESTTRLTFAPFLRFRRRSLRTGSSSHCRRRKSSGRWTCASWSTRTAMRSEEHTSELQSRLHLVCRLLLEKKKKVIQLQTVTLETSGRS